MKTKIIKIDSQGPKDEDLQEAANVIRNGGLVIIPTETVYGIAANMLNRDSIERLYQIKKRPKDKPFSLLIDRKEKINDFSFYLPPGGYKLMDKFWPGPLTIVVKLKESFSVPGFGFNKNNRERTIAIRMPDNEIALKITEDSRVPIACPSANLSGNPAPVDFGSAINDLNGLVDFAIDAGDTKLGMESSIVDLSVEQPVVLREGAIKKRDIEDLLKKKIILFVCTGNSCRSVMAEALLKKILKNKNRRDTEVLSAGIMMLHGMGATESTKEVLREEGIDVSDHLSQGVTKEMIGRSDLILVMEKIHERKILEISPEAKNRVFLLKEFAKIDGSGNLDIVDPVGKSMGFYENTFSVIKEAVEKVSELI